MSWLEKRIKDHVDLLTERHPKLKECKNEIIDAYLIMEEYYEHDGKPLITGNGGSATDAEHIAGSCKGGSKRRVLFLQSLQKS